MDQTSGSSFPKEGIIEKIYYNDWELYDIPGKNMIYFEVAKVGDEVKYENSASRVNFLITTGKDEKEAKARLKSGLDNIHIVTR